MKKKNTQNRRAIKVAVLCGGSSPEREVSLKSGERIAAALRSLGYPTAVIDPIARYTEKEMRFTIKATRKCSCGKSKARKRRGENCTPTQFTISALRYCKKADTVFLALHGGAGEDGRIAAVLECMGIRHTGSDHKGLCLSMDKAISKQIMEHSGIRTPEYVLLHGGNKADATVRPDSFPCVVKPICGGSSIGVFMAESQEELNEILKSRTSQKEDVLIERRIIGREFTVGVLDGKALAVTEIIPKSGFYDYKNKYVKGRTEEITPARIEKETENELKTAALATHNTLHLGSYSRIDMMVEAETGAVYVLEANALPGMTETSLLPHGAASSGIDFNTLCEKMLFPRRRRATAVEI